MLKLKRIDKKLIKDDAYYLLVRRFTNPMHKDIFVGESHLHDNTDGTRYIAIHVDGYGMIFDSKTELFDEIYEIIEEN